MFDNSVKSGSYLSRFKLELVWLVIKLAKAKVGQDGDKVRKVKDQVVKARARSLTIS